MTIFKNIKGILKHDEISLNNLLLKNNSKILLANVLVIMIFGGFYAGSIGYWRGLQQALFAAIKFPIIILVTVFTNALINWLFSLFLGLKLSLRQSINIILYSFSICTIILFSLIPIVLFIIYNIPTVNSELNMYGLSIVTQINVLFIAIAGILANVRLYKFLIHLSSKHIAKIILFTWLTMNLFLGAQLAWNFRPFIGTPGLEIEFVREEAFQGTFYEDVYKKFNQLRRMD